LGFNALAASPEKALGVTAHSGKCITAVGSLLVKRGKREVAHQVQHANPTESAELTPQWGEAVGQVMNSRPRLERATDNVL